jgi:hypothetical protein
MLSRLRELEDELLRPKLSESRYNLSQDLLYSAVLRRYRWGRSGIFVAAAARQEQTR